MHLKSVPSAAVRDFQGIAQAFDRLVNARNEADWLHPFAQILARLDPQRHGIAAEDVVRVVQAWSDVEGEAWEGGYLVDLRDGRRAHLEAVVEEGGWTPRTRVLATLHAGGFDFASDDVPPGHPVRIYGWVDGFQLLDEYLGALETARAA